MAHHSNRRWIRRWYGGRICSLFFRVCKYEMGILYTDVVISYDGFLALEKIQGEFRIKNTNQDRRLEK